MQVDFGNNVADIIDITEPLDIGYSWFRIALHYRCYRCRYRPEKTY